jgi:hypothetical protein
LKKGGKVQQDLRRNLLDNMTKLQLALEQAAFQVPGADRTDEAGLALAKAYHAFDLGIPADEHRTMKSVVYILNEVLKVEFEGRDVSSSKKAREYLISVMNTTDDDDTEMYGEDDSNGDGGEEEDDHDEEPAQTPRPKQKKRKITKAERAPSSKEKDDQDEDVWEIPPENSLGKCGGET